MKIGLIADVHANVHALQAVLEALDAERTDLTLCAGDLVCYGAYPDATLDLFRQRGVASVTGNYDAAVAYDLPRASSVPSSPRNEPLKQAALEWTKRHTSSDSRRYLRGLPWTAEYRLDDLTLRVCHATPAALDRVVGPEDPESLAELLCGRHVDVVLTGHTHRAYVRHYMGALFVNPGAVGRSLDGDTRASFAVLDVSSLEVTVHRVRYDVQAAVDGILATEMPPEIARLVGLGARRIEEVTP